MLAGFDNIGADSSATLQCLSDVGYSFDVIDALGTGWDTEYRSAAAIGMSVVLFQGFYQPFWSDPSQGTARGQLMVSNAQSVGYPQGAQVYLNLENNLTDGTNPVTRATMIRWVQNWAAAVTAAGYTAGVYVGRAAAADRRRPRFGYWQRQRAVEIGVRLGPAGRQGVRRCGNRPSPGLSAA